MTNEVKSILTSDLLSMIKIMIKSYNRHGNCESAYAFFNSLVEKSENPAATKAYFEFLMDAYSNSKAA